jgi:hypothetical protein
MIVPHATLGVVNISYPSNCTSAGRCCPPGYVMTGERENGTPICVTEAQWAADQAAAASIPYQPVEAEPLTVYDEMGNPVTLENGMPQLVQGVAGSSMWTKPQIDAYWARIAAENAANQGGGLFGGKFSNIMEAATIGTLAAIGGAGISASIGGTATAGVAESGTAELSTAAPVASPLPVVEPVSEIAIAPSEVSTVEMPLASTEVLPSAVDLAPSELPSSALVSEPAGAAVDTPAVVTEAAKPGVIAAIAKSTGSLASAEAVFKQLYTAVKGTPGNSPTYQRTQGQATLPGTGAASEDQLGGMGANLSPLLKHLAIPAALAVISLWV